MRTLLINERDRRVDDSDTHVSSAGAYLHGQQVLLEGHAMRPAELQAKLKTLRLGGMLHTLEMRRGQAEDQRLGHVEFLALLLDDEIDRRQSKMLAQRLHRARFEEEKTLEEFDFSFNPQIPAEQLRNLATCALRGTT